MGKSRSTKERKRLFLEAVGRGASVVEACVHAGVARSTVYAWAESDASFEAAWSVSEMEVTEVLRRRAFEMAMGGNVRLIIFLLSAAERRVGGGVKGEVEEKVGAIEIIGLKEGEKRDGDFIQFVET